MSCFDATPFDSKKALRLGSQLNRKVLFFILISLLIKTYALISVFLLIPFLRSIMHGIKTSNATIAAAKNICAHGS